MRGKLLYATKFEKLIRRVNKNVDGEINGTSGPFLRICN